MPRPTPYQQAVADRSLADALAQLGAELDRLHALTASLADAARTLGTPRAPQAQGEGEGA